MSYSDRRHSHLLLMLLLQNVSLFILPDFNLLSDIRRHVFFPFPPVRKLRDISLDDAFIIFNSSSLERKDLKQDIQFEIS